MVYLVDFSTTIYPGKIEAGLARFCQPSRVCTDARPNIDWNEYI